MNETVWASLADTLLPGDGNLPPATRAGADKRLREIVGWLPRHLRLGIALLLWGLEQAPRFTRGRPFSRLTFEEREGLIAKRGGSGGALAAAWDALKFMTVSSYLDNPEISRILELDASPECDHSRPGPAWRPVMPAEWPGALEGEFDAVIVGSGAGGAVTAAELASGGWSVAVLEEGDRENGTGAGERPLEALKRYYRDGGATFALGSPSILVPVGRAVGGTTVINSGTCMRLPHRVLAGWRENHGFSASDAEWEELNDGVERMLEAAPSDWAIIGGNGRVAHKGAQLLGLNGAPLTRNAPGCRGCGRCGLGCPGGAAKGVHWSYLPRAVNRGAKVFARCHVEKILFHGDRATGVVGRLDFGTFTKPFRLTAKRAVILAAGAPCTPTLLRRSGVQNPELGANLHLHPCAILTGVFREEIRPHHGVMQSYGIHDLAGEGIVLEATFPPPVLAYAEAILSRSAAQRIVSLRSYNHLASIGVMIADKGSGSVRQFGGNNALFMRYRLDKDDRGRLFKGMALASRVLFAAGAIELHPMIVGAGALRDERSAETCFNADWPAGSLRLTGFHPQGTVRFGQDARSPLDEFGSVRSVSRLAVTDASVFPTALGANPQVSIMAFAARACRRMLEDW